MENTLIKIITGEDNTFISHSFEYGHFNMDPDHEYSAITISHICAIECLIDAGVNINANNSQALRVAARVGRLEIVKLLVENGANIHANDDAALLSAVTYFHFEVVKYLIDKGADIHANESQALRTSLSNDYGSRFNIFKLLVENGANIHVRDNYPLREASRQGHLKAVKLLVEYGANIHAKDNQAIYLAWNNNRSDVVKFLAERGASMLGIYKSRAYITTSIGICVVAVSPLVIAMGVLSIPLLPIAFVASLSDSYNNKNRI